MPPTSKIPLVLMLVLGCAGTLALGGCPAPVCPDCSVKTGYFTIPSTPSGAAIDTVILHATGTFTGHCNGEPGPDPCSLAEDKDLGALREGKQSTPMPWTSDKNDVLAARAEIRYRSTTGGTPPSPVFVDATIGA